MNRLSRSTVLKIAALLAIASGLFTVFANIPFMAQGAEAINQSDQPPYFVIVVGFALGILYLVAAYGLWQQQRWAVLLIVLAAALDLLLGAPGILFAPVRWMQITSLGQVIVDLAIIVLCLRREPKRAIA